MCERTESNNLKAKAIFSSFGAVLSQFGAGLNDLNTSGEAALDLRKKFLLVNAVHGILDVILGSSVVRVPRQLIDIVKMSNRTVSFILDGRIHYATGILVSPRHVLTAAHVFLDEEGRLVDENRIQRTSVEAHTTYFDNIIMEGPRSLSNLDEAWLLDPKLDSTGKANRDVRLLDFAIITLKQPLGNDPVGNGELRQWVPIPKPAEAQVLSPNLSLRVFQFLDRDALFSSSGNVRRLNRNGLRVLHTASTLDSASGSAMVDDEFNLVALHLGGAASGEQPKSNRGLPIRRIAESIDEVRDGTTVRSQLK